MERTEREMIHRVFELEDTLVREVMVPRPDMFCLDVSPPPLEQILPLLRENLHSRVPVFEDTVDQIVGRALHQGPAAPPPAGCRPDFDLRAASAPAVLRAGVEAGRRPPARVPGQEAPPRHRGGRVRRHRGARHPRGSARGAGRRDPRRVRRGGAPDPARWASARSGCRASCRIDELQRRHRPRGSPTSPSTRWGAGCSTSSAACPTRARRRSRTASAVTVEKVERTRVVEVLVALPEAPRRRSAA